MQKNNPYLIPYQKKKKDQLGMGHKGKKSYHITLVKTKGLNLTELGLHTFLKYDMKS